MARKRRRDWETRCAKTARMGTAEALKLGYRPGSTLRVARRLVLGVPSLLITCGVDEKAVRVLQGMEEHGRVVLAEGKLYA